MWMTPPYANDARLPDHKKDTMAESMVSKYRDVQILKLKPLELDVLDLFLEGERSWKCVLAHTPSNSFAHVPSGIQLGR